MENYRFVKQDIILLGGMLLILLAIPFFIFAYDDQTTHPALTDEIIDHFNRFEPDKALSVSQKELVKQGSIDEDSGVRWLWHFYDPTKNRGLVLGNDDLLRNPELAAIIGSSRSEWQSSKEWAQNTSAQAVLSGGSGYGSIFSFFSSPSDFSWERAVYEYAWGDKNRAMLALGHILHLIEDASVPDHTRNDPHPHVTEWSSTFNKSPYEIWTKRFTDENYSTEISTPPVILGSLNEYFDSMARYSNGNFFSKDTTPDKSSEYSSPPLGKITIEKLKTGTPAQFVYDATNQYRLALIKSDVVSDKIEYFLKDDDLLILSDYWSHLSRQAILHGAGVMKLFFDEVSREQQTKTLYNKNRSWWRKMGDSITSAWQSVVGGTAVPPSNSLATMIDVAPPAGGETSANGARIEVSPPAGGETSTAAGSEASAPPQTEIPTELVALSLASSKPVSAATPSVQNPPLVFMAGGAGPTKTRIEVSPPAGGETSETAMPPDTTPPDAPIITTPAQTLQTASRVTFSGTAEAGAIILTDFDNATTVAGIEASPPSGGEASTTTGTWSLALNLPQGTTTITFFAKDVAGNTSTGTVKTMFVDSEAPDISLAIDECASSFSQNGCLIATTTITLRWSSNARDLAAYEIICAKDTNGVCDNFSYDPAATSTNFLVENNHTYIFTAKARDTNSNESSTTKTAEVRITPVVINEIAWAGTLANNQPDEDEWIELKNNSGYAINLSGWRLYSETDGKPDVALSGVIPPNGYYLLERTDDNTVSDIPADWSGSFGAASGSDLGNTGEVLALAYGNTTIDQTPPLNACGRRTWCAGDAASKASMERIDPLLAGTSVANWATNNIIKTGKDAAGSAISGTPKARNSANYDIGRLWRAHSEPTTFTLPKNVYMIDANGFTVHIGITLALEPGAIIKFVSTGNPLWVSGTLKAEGAAHDPVVFTSIYDDAYGGDTNGDGVCNPENASSTAACPQPGSWKQIYISPNSVNTILNHVIIRYGGSNNMFFRSMLAVDSANITLANSTLEHSWSHGLYAANSDSIIEDNIFRNNTRQSDDLGFLIGGGNPTMRRNTSLNNSVGGSLSGVGGVFSDNTFTNNTNEALKLSGAVPAMSGTTASGNGINGILLQSVPPDFTFQSGLPYIIENQYILASGNYSFEPGVIIKAKTSSANLTFDVPVNIAGAGGNPIVFTSFYDDEYGGDTNGDGVCNPEDASSTAACPYAGAWGGLQFLAGADGSTVTNAIIRYGGSRTPWAGIKADRASLAIGKSVIEHNYRKGIFLQVSTSTITDTIIRNHTKSDNNADASGLYLAGSHADIGGLTFRNNAVGINAPDALAGGSSITVTGLIDIDVSNAVKTIPAGLVP